ncbi:MAG: hypothetical protein ACTSU5_18360 [Promethearchaeota archaeon]
MFFQFHQEAHEMAKNSPACPDRFLDPTKHALFPSDSLYEYGRSGMAPGVNMRGGKVLEVVDCDYR